MVVNDPDDSSSTSSSLEEWIRDVAASEGVSEQEVVERMMSAYWIVTELGGFIDESHTDSSEHSRAQASDLGGNRTPEESAPDGDDSVEDLLRLARLVEETSPSATQGNDNVGESDALRQLTPKLDRLSQDVERLVSHLDHSTDRGVEAARTGDTADTVDSHSAVADLSDEVSDLAERLENLESRHSAGQREVNENFSYVEEILTHLVERINGFEDRVDELDESLATVESSIGDSRLADIKRTANVQGIDEARCDGCDETVKVSLLEEPECPQCHRQFDDLSREPRWFGLSSVDVLTVSTPADGRRERGATSSRSSRRTPPPAPTNDSPDSDPGEWPADERTTARTDRSDDAAEAPEQLTQLKSALDSSYSETSFEDESTAFDWTIDPESPQSPRRRPPEE